MVDCVISVKLKLPDLSVVVVLPASAPLRAELTTDTVASGMGTRVRLVMTCPLRVNVRLEGVASDGATGDAMSVSPPRQASIGRRSNSVVARKFVIVETCAIPHLMKSSQRVEM